MAKDRAAPFSRKHRKYWIPVTGGMILIGLLNIVLGLCIYKPPVEPTRIDLHLDRHGAPGTLEPREIPGDVMRSFNGKYPRTIPAGATRQGKLYVIAFPPNATHHHATFESDGRFISED